jgi:hypothetical protein
MKNAFSETALTAPSIGFRRKDNVLLGNYNDNIAKLRQSFCDSAWQALHDGSVEDFSVAGGLARQSPRERSSYIRTRARHAFHHVDAPQPSA